VHAVVDLLAAYVADGAVIGAEAAGDAGGLTALRDGFPMREEDGVVGVVVASRISGRCRCNASAGT